MHVLTRYRGVLLSFIAGLIVMALGHKTYQYMWWRMRTAAEMERVHTWGAYIDPDDPTLPRRIGAALLPKAQATNLYKTLEIVQDIFDKHGIVYWACDGTLLGAIRCGGVIPTDDDADIAVREADVPKIKALKSVFARAGFGIVPSLEGFWIVHLNNKGTGFSLDVCVTKEVSSNGKKEYILSSPEAQKTWPTFRFEVKNLFPLKRVSFGPITTFVPRNPYPHLDRSYKNWNSVAYIWNHGHPFPPFYATLTPQLRRPAPWDEEAFKK